MRLVILILAIFSLSGCSRVAFKMDEKIKAMDAGVLSGPPMGDGGTGVVPTTPGGPNHPGDNPPPGGGGGGDVVVVQPSPTPNVPGNPPVVVVHPTPTPVMPPGNPPVIVVNPTPIVDVVNPTPIVDVVNPTPIVDVVNPTPIVDVVNPTPTPSVETPGTPDLSVPVSRHCSDFKTLDQKTNINQAKSIVVTVSRDQAVQCVLNNTQSLRYSINQGSLPLQGCTLSNGTYNLDVMADGKNMNVKEQNTFTVANGAIASSDVELLVDSNPDIKLSLGRIGKFTKGTQCDIKASPLFVDFRKDSKDYDILSSPQNGVMFDILGQNGDGNKIQISWFQRRKYGLLALPNSRGEVLNIDQLFGDNTMGPDGKFASNGFTALAKHDSNGDQVIDKYDRVFTSLRLWFDFNRDGKADRRELKTLSEMKLVAIGLVYDKGFREVDKYGNELKYKSVVKFKSGKLRSIFDIWFKLP